MSGIKVVDFPKIATPKQSANEALIRAYQWIEARGDGIDYKCAVIIVAGGESKVLTNVSVLEAVGAFEFANHCLLRRSIDDVNEPL